MNLSRRDMLKLTAGGAALLATGIRPAAADDKPAKKIPLGVQLYSIRDVCGRDLPGALAAVAKMGYEGVEFAGYQGRSAAQLRKMLDDNNLKCCGTHLGLDAIQGNNLKKTIEFNKVLGNKFLIVASMGVPRTLKDTIARAKQFNQAAETAKIEGMRVGYHAHGGDFHKIGGETFWDLFFSNTSPDVVMQLDTGNCLDGGADPYAVLKKFPGRAATIHLKEHGGKSGAAIGDGTVKWDEIFRLCETPGGTEWYIAEQESYSGTSMEGIQKCIENLRKMGK